MRTSIVHRRSAKKLPVVLVLATLSTASLLWLTPSITATDWPNPELAGVEALVLDIEGMPVPGAAVWAYYKDRPVQQVYGIRRYPDGRWTPLAYDLASGGTGLSGRHARMQFVPGRYKFIAQDEPKDHPPSEPIWVDLEPGKVVFLTFRLPIKVSDMEMVVWEGMCVPRDSTC